MAIGNWGRGLVFETSDRRILTPTNLTRSVSGVWATHSRIGAKDEAEFLRPAVQKVSFDLELNAEHGVRPRAMLEYLEWAVETGTVEIMVIGGRRIGRHYWRITETSEAWQVIMNGGEMVKAKVTVKMEEYL